MDILEALAAMIIYIVVVFVVVEFVKKIVKQMSDPPGWVFFLVSIALGVVIAWGWSLRLLPAPAVPEFVFVDIVLTGIIIGAAASGLFSGLDNAFPDLNL